MEVVAGKDQSLQADERTAAFTNETIPYTKKRRTCEINIRIHLITTGSYFVALFDLVSSGHDAVESVSTFYDYLDQAIIRRNCRHIIRSVPFVAVARCYL